MSKLKNVPVITDECKEAFKKLSTLNIKNCQDFDALAKSIGYTDKNFVNFLKDTSYSEKTLDNYNQYLQKASSSTSKFAATLTSVAANMTIMVIVNFAIKKAIALWDKYNVTVAETQEKIDDINSSLSTLNSEYDELKNRDIDTLSESEKARLDYHEKRIDAEKRLLEIEKKKQAQEAVGTKITDAFDKDNLNNQYSKIVDDYLLYDGQIKNDLKKYQENLDKFEKTGESKYKDNADKYESDIDHKIVILQENYEKLLSIKETLQSYIDEGLLSGDDLTKAQTLIANIDGSLSQHKSIINEVDNTVSKTIDKADALAERLKNVSSEDIQKNFSAEEIIALGENFDENATVEDLKKALEEAQKEADKNPVEGKLSFADSVKNINEKLAPLSKLGDIFNDVANGDSFNLSSLFDNDFVSTFGQYEEAYDNFVKTVTSSPSDIEKCQSVFNDLATEFIYGSGVLDNLTNSNKEVRQYNVKWFDKGTLVQEDTVDVYSDVEFNGDCPESDLNNFFVGWDKEAKNITHNLVINSVYIVATVPEIKSSSTGSPNNLTEDNDNIIFEKLLKETI